MRSPSEPNHMQMMKSVENGPKPEPTMLHLQVFERHMVLRSRPANPVSVLTKPFRLWIPSKAPGFFLRRRVSTSSPDRNLNPTTTQPTSHSFRAAWISLAHTRDRHFLNYRLVRLQELLSPPSKPANNPHHLTTPPVFLSPVTALALITP